MKVHHRIISCIMVLAMLVSIFSVFGVNVASAAQGASSITLTMSDSYGDGWNGNGIAVYINGVSSGQYTFSSGSSATYSISYDSSNTYEFKWIKGSFSNECSFTIKLGGEVLLSATQAQCGSFTNNYSLLTIESVQEEEIPCDLEGVFAGGTGTTADPYLVATKAQLNNVRKYPNANFRQVRNIAFDASDFEVSGDFYNEGKGWEPIGVDYDNAFLGTYDGNRYTIDGLTITANASQYRYIGLFGYAFGDIVNVKLTNIDYTATGYVRVGGVVGHTSFNEIIGCSAGGVIRAENGVIGGIAGDAYKVQHCQSNVSIDASSATSISVGGIVGSAFGGIRYCENSGNITVDGDSEALIWVGGIVGDLGNGINDCQNNGNITVSGASSILVYAGGITAQAYCDITRCENNGALSSSGQNVRIGGIVGEIDSYTISECVNRGNVSAVHSTVHSYVGGIVGEALMSTINNCYVTDTVTLTARGTSMAVAGGIAGYLWDDSSITNCYSLVNSVTVNTGASGWGRGGIAGHNYGTISNCYYRYTYGVGYNNGSLSAGRFSSLSSYESKSTYSGFDFTSVWQMGTGSYEYATLRMESGHTHSLTYNAATVTHESAGNLENWYCAGCQIYFRNSAGTRYTTADMLSSDPLPLEGQCGTDVIWKLTPEGELTISGNGRMDDYTDSNPAPWYEYRAKVKRVTVEQGVTSIGNNAFKKCANLTKVTFADTIVEIGDGAFSECSNIARMLIPDKVTCVGDRAFSSITNLIIGFEGDAPYFGGSNVFSNTSGTVYYPGHDTTWTADIMQEQTGSITWTPYTSIDDVIIASGSFYYDYTDIYWNFALSGKLTVTGEYSSTELPDYSFSQRPAWEIYKDDIISVKLVNISTIGEDTFYEYSTLKSINFGTVKEVGSYAFYGCSALESVFLEEFWAKDVTIEEYAFYDCSSLQRVAFPRGTTIEDYAFSGCPQLDEIYVTTYSEYGGTPLSPTSNGFHGVTATVYVPINWEYFRDYGDFGGSLSWKEVTYGPCGSDAFWTYDANTSTITITGTGSIASYYVGSAYPWYSLYSNVTKVIFEDGVTDIPSYVFEYMSNIKTVRLPNTLQKLACDAFNKCTSLNNIIIPASVTALDYMGYFNGCTSLTDVYYMGTAQEWSCIENNTVVGNRNIHYLVLTERAEPTCTTVGMEAYYQFDDASVYPAYYNLDKQPIAQPALIPVLGHDYETNWTTDTAPTCTAVGSKSHHCSRCDDKIDATDIPANGHTNAESVVENKVDATCTAEGHYDSVIYCSACKAELSRETIFTSKVDHQYSDQGVCTVCGDKKEFLAGDINGDGSVTVLDISALIDIASGDGSVVFFAPPDINGDGSVTVLDVSALIDIASGKK